MRIRTKVSLLIVFSTIAMVVMLAGVSLLSFHYTSLDNEREHGALASELARNELMLSFLAGSFEHKELEEHVRAHIPDLNEIRIVRAQATTDQFGPGEHSPNEIEMSVLKSGSSKDQLIETDEGVKYQYISPYYAEKSCLQCHNVPEGTLLGMINIELDLTDQRTDAMKSTYFLIAVFIVFALTLGFILRQLLMPIVATATSMRDVVSQAKEGIFSGRMKKQGSDELAQVAIHTNHLMETLEESFGTIIKEVESMETHDISGSEKNLLTRTVTSVKTMVSAVHFKQTIEADRNLNEVYERIFQVLSNQFQVERFSLYEINHDKQLMKVIFSHGLPEDEELWCESELTFDTNACRACRTAHDVDSEGEENLCSAFIGKRLKASLGEKLNHFCIPLMQGGRIGVVLQIIYKPSESEEMKSKLPYIRTYLSEAAPVIESKRLTEVLHESTLKDPMTGLYNRRFLDQFKARLIATAERNKSTVSFLMCDIDHFKEVNDSYGHKTGDTVLITAARIMSQSIRLSDYLIRFGGEEFLAIIPEAEESRVMEISERMRRGLEEHVFDTETSTFSKTLSIGISIYSVDSERFEECIHLADAALYVAKESGRNKVVRYEAGMVKEEPNKEP